MLSSRTIHTHTVEIMLEIHDIGQNSTCKTAGNISDKTLRGLVDIVAVDMLWLMDEGDEVRSKVDEAGLLGLLAFPPSLEQD